MAEQLYDQSAYIRSFEAKVVSCEARDGGYGIVLDRTAFFPEQGGQYADRGVLRISAEKTDAQGAPEDRAVEQGAQGAPEDRAAEQGAQGAPDDKAADAVKVLDVRMESGEIVHMTDAPLAPGMRVRGELDWADRYDKMQQHTGEHIVSGIVHRRTGFNNVGFRLGPEHVTMDYSGELSFEEMLEVEGEANEAVWKNLPVIVTYPTAEELQSITYRSKIEIEGQIRIVEVPGYDVCACCAPHVERTGEIGIIKIINVQRYKGGIRVNMLCGARAIADYNMRLVELRETSNLLSVREDMTCAAAKKLKDDSIDLKVRLGRTKYELVNRIIDEAASGGPVQEENFILFEEGMDKRDMIRAADRMADMRKGFCGIINGNDREGYLFVLASRDRDCRELAGAMRSALGAKGGGSAQMIQGSLQAKEREIKELLDRS